MKELRLELPFSVRRPILACGADMKGAYVLAKGNEAYFAGGFGDLSDPDNLSRYEKSISSRARSLKISPSIVVCDLHPGYFSTHFSENLRLSAKRSEASPKGTTYDLRLYKVQHHEAHIASCILDNDIRGPVIGVAFDGTGYGSDGNIWGGEFFTGGLRKFTRAAHFDYIPMPGGEAVIREPWRMAASCLYAAFGADFRRLKIDFVRRMDRKKWKVLKTMIDQSINSPITSSAGRLFDAAASLVLAKDSVSAEAEGPMALERIADKSVLGSYDSKNTLKIIRDMVKDLSRKEDSGVICAKFHNSVAEAILSTCMGLRRRHGLKTAALSGGVFQNRFLLTRAKDLLEKKGFSVYANSRIPTNDYGIPAGQLAIANVRHGLCV